MRHCDHHELYECDFSNFVMKSLIFYMIHNGSTFDLLHEQFFCEFLKKNFVKMTYHKCHITGGYSTLGFMFLSGDICHLAYIPATFLNFCLYFGCKVIPSAIQAGPDFKTVAPMRAKSHISPL